MQYTAHQFLNVHGKAPKKAHSNAVVVSRKVKSVGGGYKSKFSMAKK